MSAEEDFLSEVRVVAVSLRRVADIIDRHAAVRISAHDLKPDYADTAAQVVADVTNALANLRLNQLVTHAARLDRQVRRG